MGPNHCDSNWTQSASDRREQQEVVEQQARRRRGSGHHRSSNVGSSSQGPSRMSSRKVPGGSGGADESTAATAPLDDNANASVEIPASSEEPAMGVGEEMSIISKTRTSTLSVEPAKEPTVTAELEGEKELESNPVSKTPRSTPTPTLTPAVTPTASDGVAAKSVRVTRHSSPLLQIISPTTSRREVGDGELDTEEPTGSGGQRKSSVERSLAPVIRGRKSIKDLKEAKEVKSEEPPAAASESRAASGVTPGQVKEQHDADGNEMESLPITDKKDHKDTKDKGDERETNQEEEKEKSADTEIIADTEKTSEKQKYTEKDKAADKDGGKEKDIDANKDIDKEKEKVKEVLPPVVPIAPVTPTCNRVTRKFTLPRSRRLTTRVTSQFVASPLPVGANSTASLVAASSSVTEQPPPSRGRRKKPVVVAPPLEPAVKRKRSQDVEADSDANNSTKYSKVEVVKSEEAEAPEEDSSAVPIKQESVDGNEVSSISPTVTPTPTPAPTPAPVPGSRRGRGRPQNRNSSSPATTTRATRLSKAGSPVILTPVAQEPAPPKRRRVGSSTRKTVSASSLAPSSQGGAGDEDSKDSMASSMDDLLMAAADIKQEKLTPDFDDSLMPEGLPSTSGASSANGHSCTEPLTVDTEINVKPADSKVKPKESPVVAVEESPSQSETQSAKVSAHAGKAPSLSPDMISEGVSAVSVRKFYKKPEFLENNLGIEKDPELGEIVQTVSNNDTETDVEMAVDGEVNQPSTPKSQDKKKEEQEKNQKSGLKAAKKAPAKLEPKAEDISEILTDVPVDISTEAVEIIEEAEEDTCSNSSIKPGELRLDESNDEPELLLEDALIVNGDENETPDQPEEKEDQVEFFHTGEYDDFEHEIMVELAKEGVLDASGNALSQQKVELEHPEDVTLHESKNDIEAEESVERKPLKDPSVADEMEDMNEESYIDIKDQTNQLLVEHLGRRGHGSDCGPEDNKKNLSTSASSTAADGLDIQLAIKEDDDEEKPLAVIADEQKPGLLLTNDMKVDEKPNGKQESVCDEHVQLVPNLRQEQEIHLQNLGLLTHQAAEHRRKCLLEAQARQAQMQLQQHHHHQHKRQGARGGGSATHVESSGTLKTVIKLNRSSNGGVSGSGGLPTGTVIHGGCGSSSASSTSSSSVGSATRKSSGTLGSGAGAGAGVRRQSLKMTFQKGRARGHGAADRSADQYGAHAEDSYYTIQNENEDSSHSESQGQTDHGFYQMVKKDEKEKILIPEKASSFKFHPGRLCEDQCYYCSGKFGLYDTPCHVGQIKSVERQQKILANEEKLTVDNCLCDACFRHVDRRANVPSYKKRLSASGHLEMGSAAGSALEKQFAGDSGVITESGGEAGSTAAVAVQQRSCGVKDCVEAARHSLRRKCIRKRVKKYQLSLEIPAGSSNVGLCEAHYNTVIQFSGCVLCKRRLGKNHMYNITTQDTIRLEKALSEMGIPVQLGMGTAVCKLCRYFANLLIKPPDSTKAQKAEFVKNYRKRLLKVHNLQDGCHELSEADEEEAPNATETERPTSDGHEDPEMPMVADYDGPTDSNSSSSSTAALDTSKQMSKLQAILQQNVGADAAGAAGTGTVAASPGEADLGQISLTYCEGIRTFPCANFSTARKSWVCSSRCRSDAAAASVLRRAGHECRLSYNTMSRRAASGRSCKSRTKSELISAPVDTIREVLPKRRSRPSTHASSNASVYTETVRQRLNSFDHGHCGGLNIAGSPSSSGSGKRSGVPQPTGASVLATALTTPLTSHSSSSASISSEQHSSVDPVIPLVDLNDDDEGEDGAGGAGERESTNRQQDVILECLRTASVDKLTKQLSSNAVTIIARPKDKSQLSCNSGSSTSISSSSSAISSPEKWPSLRLQQSHQSSPRMHRHWPPASSGVSNSRSILKTNLLGMNKAVELVPLTTAPHAYKPTGCHKPEKQQKILDVANKQPGSQGEPVPSSALLGLQSKLKPPTHQQQVSGSGAGTSGSQKPSNVAQLLSSPPELISLHRRQTSGAAAGSSSFLQGKRLQLPRSGAGPSGAGTGTGAGAAGSRSAGGPPPPNVVILPDALTPQERHESKSWKPTLIPLEDQHKVPNKSHALYQTADGRRLPALVQVQSGGKPYLISIFDYNRMCILRREKLMRDQLLKSNAKPKPQNQQQQQGQTHQQQQNSAACAAFSNMVKLAQQHTARQQLQQLQQKPQQQQQLPTLQPGGVRLARLPQKLLMPPLTNPQIGSQAPNLQPLLSSTLDNSNNCWLWKNFPDPNQYLLNGNGGGAGSSSSKLPHLTAKPATATSSSGAANKSAGSLFTLKQQQHQQKLIDNAIMSKIPKSLTVIPQQMGGNTGGDMGGSSSPARTDDGEGGRHGH
uniref:Nuclear protein EAST n=1 Tax=Drosophila melanogaster TaxID=7227 RepID=Q9NGR9_DROME|nr:nuclear protein EAST [Drosophila melanogaster]